jgi:hypothetical protein
MAKAPITQVRYYDSTMTGAPALSVANATSPSHLCSVLRKVLVGDTGNEFNKVNISSLTRSGSTLTVVTSAGHGLSSNPVLAGTGYMVLELVGTPEANYTGMYVCTRVDGTTFTVTLDAATGANYTSSTPGDIGTCVRARGGFELLSATTNDMYFRSLDPASSLKILRVVDTGGGSPGSGNAAVAATHIYSTWVDPVFGGVVTPANRFIHKGVSNADTNSKAWKIITNGRFFILTINTGSGAQAGGTGSTNSTFFVFGDILASRPLDLGACALAGGTSAGVNSLTTVTDSVTEAYNAALHQLATDGTTSSKMGITTYTNYTQFGITTGAGATTVYPHGGTAQIANDKVLGTTVMFTYPNAPDSGFYISPVTIIGKTPSLHIRGKYPGIYEGLHGQQLPDLTYVDAVSGYPGRIFLNLATTNFVYLGQGDSTTLVFGHVLIDITGPWEA